ncbi:hypothetical protein QCA50_013825 [Cerrena zonata]|uniref:Uncharacterized protein n=1 Tax=Cerrena zonata TaxID=2478898 RepID=A0AAW0FSS5_9APHY
MRRSSPPSLSDPSSGPVLSRVCDCQRGSLTEVAEPEPGKLHTESVNRVIAFCCLRGCKLTYGLVPKCCCNAIYLIHLLV